MTAKDAVAGVANGICGVDCRGGGGEGSKSGTKSLSSWRPTEETSYGDFSARFESFD